MSNVKNFFEQPTVDGEDNTLNLSGTVKGADGAQAAFVVDGSDAATTQTLANALKAALINVGIMLPS